DAREVERGAVVGGAAEDAERARRDVARRERPPGVRSRAPDGVEAFEQPLGEEAVEGAPGAVGAVGGTRLRLGDEAGGRGGGCGQRRGEAGVAAGGGEAAQGLEAAPQARRGGEEPLLGNAELGGGGASPEREDVGDRLEPRDGVGEAR